MLRATNHVSVLAMPLAFSKVLLTGRGKLFSESLKMEFINVFLLFKWQAQKDANLHTWPYWKIVIDRVHGGIFFSFLRRKKCTCLLMRSWPLFFVFFFFYHHFRNAHFAMRCHKGWRIGLLLQFFVSFRTTMESLSSWIIISCFKSCLLNETIFTANWVLLEGHNLWFILCDACKGACLNSVAKLCHRVSIWGVQFVGLCSTCNLSCLPRTQKTYERNCPKSRGTSSAHTKLLVFTKNP